MVRSAAWLLGSAFACAASAQTPIAQTPPVANAASAAASCASAASHQFDFWIGEWEVRNPEGTVVGHSRVESILGGCVIFEHWRNAGATAEGRSFNIHNADTGRWEQFWVDNGGARLHLLGGFTGASMVLNGVQDRPNAQTHETQRERITWTPSQDGGVRQLWETSNDDGASWRTRFDGRYRPAKTP